MTILLIILVAAFQYANSMFETNHKLRANLIQAIDSNSLDQVNQALQHNPALNQSHQGILPLHRAIINGNVEIVAALLHHGARLDITDTGTGASALHYAVLSASYEMVEYILSQGVWADATTADGRTSLHFAAENAYYHLIELLISHGANPNAISHNKNAVQEGLSPARSPDLKYFKRETAKELLLNGAILHDSDENREALQSVYIDKLQPEIVLRNREFIRKTLTDHPYPICPNLLNRAFVLAAAQGDKEIFSLMMLKIDVIDREHLFDALLKASLCGHTEIVHIILQWMQKPENAYPELQKVLGYALMLAATQRREITIRALLAADANPYHAIQQIKILVQKNLLPNDVVETYKKIQSILEASPSTLEVGFSPSPWDPWAPMHALRNAGQYLGSFLPHSQQ